MTTRSCYYFTLYLPVEESPNTNLQSHSISVVILPSSYTHSMMQVRKEGSVEWYRKVVGDVECCLFRWCKYHTRVFVYDMRRAFRRHAQWLNASWSNGCQTTILRNKHMTITSCSRLTLYHPVKESPNTHSHAISAIPPLLPHTHTHIRRCR